MPCRWIYLLPAASLTVAALLATGGCGGSDRASVSGGFVLSDGAPLVGARVIARSSETGKTAYETTDAKGNFEFSDGLLPGNYAVSILEDSGDPDNRRRPSIAAKYRNPSTSGISISVQAGDKESINLTLAPR